MKRLALLVAVILAPTLSRAWEIPENPDRFPSLALTGLTGEAEQNSQNKSETNAFGLGLRLPFAVNTTVDVNYLNQTDKVTAASVGNNFKGDYYSATLRIYFVSDKKR